MEKEQKINIARIAASAVMTLILYFLPTEGLLRLLLFVVPYLLAGYDVIFDAVKNIFQGNFFGEEFLMTIATLGAFATGDYAEAAAVMIFYKTGELFEDIAVGRSRRSITALMDIRPDSATVLRGGNEYTVSPENVKKGETIVIRPGERIALDGVIIRGSTSVNTSALTGESLPSDKTVNDRVISGCVNISSVIYVRTESEYGESTASKILRLAESAAEKKAKTENFITRFSRVYTPCVVAGAVLLAVIPPLFFSGEWLDWINRALVFLVVSCPCALVISVPLSYFGGIGAASKRGVLIKGSAYLEALSGADAFVFDKTGTLTKGSFYVEAIHPSHISADELLDIAAAAESYSTHPVAESIVREHGGHIDKNRISKVSERPGEGIEAIIDGRKIYVGNAKLMMSAGADYHECHLTGTVIHISHENDYLGHIVIKDEIKPDSALAIRELKALGIRKTVMLTGDGEKTAKAVALKTGVDEYHSGLMPDTKVSRVDGLINEGYRVAFVGDGINDAPVLARSDVGIAMGALGSDAAVEAADIVLMDDKPSRLSDAVGISRKTMRLVRENIIFALSVKAVILVLGALNLTGMWAAVFGDVGVMILATLNSLRALTPPKKSNQR